MNFTQLFKKYAGVDGNMDVNKLQVLLSTPSISVQMLPEALRRPGCAQIFLREVLGKVDRPTTRYFQAMFDLDGDGQVSMKEMVSCVNDTLEVVSKVSLKVVPGCPCGHLLGDFDGPAAISCRRCQPARRSRPITGSRRILCMWLESPLAIW